MIYYMCMLSKTKLPLPRSSGSDDSDYNGTLLD